jgi:hypothetical protein
MVPHFKMCALWCHSAYSRMITWLDVFSVGCGTAAAASETWDDFCFVPDAVNWFTDEKTNKSGNASYREKHCNEHDRTAKKGCDVGNFRK